MGLFSTIGQRTQSLFSSVGPKFSITPNPIGQTNLSFSQSTPQTTKYGTEDLLKDIFYTPTKIRAPFAKEEETLPGGLFTNIGANLASRTLEWIPRTVIQGIANIFALKGRETNLPFDAGRLGLAQGNRVPTTGENYLNNPDVQEWLASPTIKNLPRATKGALLTVGSDILDAFASGAMLKSIANSILRNIAVPEAEHIIAWKGLGMPSTLREAQRTARGLLLDLSAETRGFSTGGTETAQNINNFMRVLENQGIPKNPNLITSNIRKIAQALNTPVEDIYQVLRNGEVQAPFVRPKGYLPGRAIEGEPQPSFGLSIQPEKRVGYGEVSPELQNRVKTTSPAENVSGVSSREPALKSPAVSPQLGPTAKPSLTRTTLPESTAITEVGQDTILDQARRDFERAESEVLADLETSRPGERLFINGEVKGISSTFPSFVPDELRSTKLFSSFTEKYIKGEKLGVREQRLADVFEKEVLTRMEPKLADEIQVNKFIVSVEEKRAMEQNAFLKAIEKGIVEKLRNKRFTIKQFIRGKEASFKSGYKAGQQEARTRITDQLRDKIENQNQVRSDIVDYIKQNIPISDRGVFLNMVKDAKTQTDLIHAFTRIDKKANDVLIRQSISTLKKTVEKMTESNAVSADYKAKIKDIIDNYELTGHTQATIDKLKSTQEYINRQSSIGENTEIPQRIVDKLKILERTPKDQLTLEQIQGLQEEVELLAQLGETKWSSKQALYEGEKDLRKQELLDSATSINSKEVKNIGLEKSPPKYVTTYIKARNYLQKTRIGLTPIEGLADITGMQPMKRVLDLDFGNYLVYNDVSIKEWYELTKDFDESNFKRIGAYAIAQQKGGIERLANNGITAEQAQELTLTPEETKAYEFARKTFDAEFPAVKKYALDVYNKDVGEVKNYVSFMADHDAMNELELYDRFGTPEFPAKTKTVEQGFTEKRAELAENKLELNIDKIFRRHIDDVAYMLTMGRDIKQYFEIVNSPEMREKLGDVGSLAWLQYLDLMARKGGSEGAKRIAILDTLRKNLALGVLSFRISSAAVQLTSFTDTIGTIGVEWAMKGASSIATSREWRNFVMDNFSEVRKAVGDDIAFREFGEGFLSKIGQVGLVPLQKLDGLMRATAVVGHYQKLLAEKGMAMDFVKPDKNLIQEATKTMRQSQGSSFFKDQPLSITTNFGLTDNKSLNKALLTFQSFLLNRWDNLQRQIWRTGIKEGRYAKASMSFLWMVIVASAMEEGIRRSIKYGINKGTELVTGKGADSQDSFLENSAINIIQSVPIAGQLVSSMQYSSNPVPILNSFNQTLTGANSVWNGKALQTKVKGGVLLAGASGSLLGVPGSSQASQIIRGLIPSPKTQTDRGMDELERLNKLSPAEANAIMKGYKETDPSLYNSIKKLKQDERLGITEADKKIREIGVQNKERATFIYKEALKLKTSEERNAYIKELRRKKIITDEVLKQIKVLKGK